MLFGRYHVGTANAAVGVGSDTKQSSVQNAIEVERMNFVLEAGECKVMNRKLKNLGDMGCAA